MNGFHIFSLKLNCLMHEQKGYSSNDLKLPVYEFNRFNNYSVGYNVSVVLGHRALQGKVTSCIINSI